MKQRRWPLFVLFFLLGSLMLDSCSFSVEVLPTPTHQPKNTETPTMVPTLTPTQPVILPSETPTLIPIRTDTLSMLQIFTSVDGGELPRSLAFTPDSAVLAAAGGNQSDFSIHLWDVVNGQSLGTLEGHTGIIWAIAFSPDGQMLASVSNDKTAKIWDWRNKSLITSLDFPADAVSVAFSSDGQTLAVGGVDEPSQNAAVWTYTVGSWNRLLKLPEYIDIAALAYSPDGRWILGGGTSRNVKVWRASDGTAVYTLNHAHQVTKVAVSPDSSTVAAATCINAVSSECMEGGIWLWDLPTGKLLKKLANFPSMVESVAFTVDGSALIAVSRDGTIRVYAIPNYDATFEAAPPGGNGLMTLSPNGDLLATGGANGSIHVWKVVYRP